MINDVGNIKNGLPKGWEWIPLEKVCEKVEKVKYAERNPDEEFYYIDIGNIDNFSNKIIGHKVYKWKDAPSRAQQVIKKGDVLFSTVRTYLKNIALVDSDVYDCHIASSGFSILRGKPSILHPKYLFYRAISSEFLNPLNELQTGSSYPAVRNKDVFSQEIPLPAYEMQIEIVAKIDELFSELDKSIEQLKTAQQQLEVYRQSVLKWAFEGRFANSEIDENNLPTTWKIVSITDLVEANRHSLKAGPFGSSLKKEFYTESGYKIYGQEQVINANPFYGDYYISEAKYRELFANHVKPHDVLISLVGTVGKVLILPENCEAGIINPRLIKISLNRSKYLPAFFKYYFESSKVKNIYSAKTQGTTMDVLNLGIIKTIPFPLCSIVEQKEIIKEIEKRLSVADKLSDENQISLKKAEIIRQGILKKAFEGQFL